MPITKPKTCITKTRKPWSEEGQNCSSKPPLVAHIVSGVRAIFRDGVVAAGRWYMVHGLSPTLAWCPGLMVWGWTRKISGRHAGMIDRHDTDLNIWDTPAAPASMQRDGAYNAGGCIHRTYLPKGARNYHLHKVRSRQAPETTSEAEHCLGANLESHAPVHNHANLFCILSKLCSDSCNALC